MSTSVAWATIGYVSLTIVSGLVLVGNVVTFARGYEALKIGILIFGVIGLISAIATVALGQRFDDEVRKIWGGIAIAINVATILVCILEFLPHHLGSVKTTSYSATKSR